jgi:hypothetical protein
MSRRVALAALITAVAGVSGCGGSSHRSVSRAGFIAQLNQLCNKGNAAFAAAPNAKTATAVVAQYVAKFRALTPPDSLRSLYDRYTSVLAEEVVRLQNGDPNGLAQLAHTKARPLASQIGAYDCANPH